jgi:phosphoglycerate kinase
MSHKGAFSVIGGGDSVAVANMLHATKDIDYLSTAGGASLAFLGCQKLPGLFVFE